MGRNHRVPWAALGVGLMACPLLSGCLTAVAWPSVAVTPVLQVNAAADQVRAFRVEKDASVRQSMSLDWKNEYRLSEASVSSGGWVWPEGRVACDSFWIVGIHMTAEHHSVAIRLYRPGCRTVEVTAWDLPESVKWTGVADLADQEKAVDDLVSIPAPSPRSHMRQRDPDEPSQDPAPDDSLPFLAPGSISPEHRKALLFAASEYERVAKGAKDDAASQAIRDRMLKKAEWLRERAEK